MVRKTTPTTVLVDADSYVYQAAFSAEETFEWDEDQITVNVDMAKARALILDTVGPPLKRGNLVVCHSDKNSDFREAF